MCKLLLEFAATTINYFSLSLWSLAKDFFTIQRTATSWNTLHYERQLCARSHRKRPMDVSPWTHLHTQWRRPVETAITCKNFTLIYTLFVPVWRNLSILKYTSNTFWNTLQMLRGNMCKWLHSLLEICALLIVLLKVWRTFIDLFHVHVTYLPTCKVTNLEILAKNFYKPGDSVKYMEILAGHFFRDNKPQDFFK